METTLDIRKDFLEAIEKTLIGPKDESEQIHERPTEKYLYGFLWPSHMAAIQIQTNEQIEEESEITGTDEVLIGEDTEANSRDNLPSNLINRQSCIGISFCIPAQCNEIELDIGYGIYTKVELSLIHI